MDSNQAYPGKCEMDTNMPKRPANAFFLFKEELRKELNMNGPSNRRFSSAASERWKILSDEEKFPYVLKAHELKTKVEDNIEDELEGTDKSMTDRSEFDKSDSDRLEFDKLESVKSECEVVDEHGEGSSSVMVNGGNIKNETEEDELKTIITDFARFEETFTPVRTINPPKATNLHKHLDELEKLISLPLETLLQSANLIRLQNILKLVKDLPLIGTKLSEWCNTLLEVTTVMPKQRIGIQKLLMETEAKAEAMVQLQKEAADIRKRTLQDLKLEEEYSTSIQRVDAKIDNLKRQLVEAEAEKATLIQLKGNITAGKYQRLKRARTVRGDLAPLIEQNAAINKIILDSKNAVKNIDCHLNALIVQFNVLRNAA